MRIIYEATEMPRYKIHEWLLAWKVVERLLDDPDGQERAEKFEDALGPGGWGDWYDLKRDLVRALEVS